VQAQPQDAHRPVRPRKMHALRRALRWLRPHDRIRYGDIEVHSKRFLDGGGSTFGQDYIRFLRSRNMPAQHRVFEWCAGPGFIGFSLLAHGLCETLCLADITPGAVRAARLTVRRNRLGKRVSVYRSDNLEHIPPHERWNLVVGNPPHFADRPWWEEIRCFDQDWRLHGAFFRDVSRFLAPRGVIVLQENNQGSTADMFRAMIEAAGLEVILVENCKGRLTPEANFYYIAIVRAGDPPPEWLRP
jgi:tRNA1(Val) A37 N6-methylase TrmN6